MDHDSTPTDYESSLNDCYWPPQLHPPPSSHGSTFATPILSSCDAPPQFALCMNKHSCHAHVYALMSVRRSIHSAWCTLPVHVALASLSAADMYGEAGQLKDLQVALTGQRSQMDLWDEKDADESEVLCVAILSSCCVQARSMCATLVPRYYMLIDDTQTHSRHVS